MSHFSESKFFIERGSDPALAKDSKATFNAFLGRHVEARIGWAGRLAESTITVTAPGAHQRGCKASDFSEHFLEEQLHKYSARRRPSAVF